MVTSERVIAYGAFRTVGSQPSQIVLCFCVFAGSSSTPLYGPQPHPNLVGLISDQVGILAVSMSRGGQAGWQYWKCRKTRFPVYLTTKDTRGISTSVGSQTPCTVSWNRDLYDNIGHQVATPT
ncbi:hypothetical protein BO82DRAFT_49827 [Aspergillus uvarum CBS 121591]|uniref:Uncharacterized protein n=1 Tax=Aspergillus uvarum CBS 121591 TaxID=1448315 RepID=A0A319CGU0_9EURO|nr:hypothetical protein BO82DRAFT_49827 [Aspergillus uvarum CBS 121591]PYH83021.1 hypothetical protein BO82DRAFT_49827 [Aspergillus uvarum CBS 121591]